MAGFGTVTTRTPPSSATPPASEGAMIVTSCTFARLFASFSNILPSLGQWVVVSMQMRIGQSSGLPHPGIPGMNKRG